MSKGMSTPEPQPTKNNTTHIQGLVIDIDIAEEHDPRCDKAWTNPPHKSHLCANCGVILETRINSHKRSGINTSRRARYMAKDLTVVAIYSGDKREFKELLLVMTQEQELTEDWKSGEKLTLSEVSYTLGERTFYNRGLLVHYKLMGEAGH